jgi:hypothetical protein
MDKILIQLLEFNGQQKQEIGPSVYHLINPAAVTWSQGILPTVQKQLGINRVVSLEERADLVGAGPGADDATRPNPAIKMLPFFRSLVARKVSLEPLCLTEVTARASSILKELEPVRAQWVHKWLSDLGVSG